MSSPVTAWEGCSRLSPYLAWGCISLREVYQRTKAAADVLRAAKKTGSKGGKGSSTGGKQQQAKGGGKRQRRGKRQQSDDEEEEAEEAEQADEAEEAEAEAAGGPDAQGPASGSNGGASGSAAVGLKDLAAFTARLRWRSHFMQVLRACGSAECAQVSAMQAGACLGCQALLIPSAHAHSNYLQKLEDEASLVSVNMCRAYDGARNEEAPPDAALFEAWCTVSAVTGIQARHCVLCKSGRLCLSCIPLLASEAQRFLHATLPAQAGADGLPHGGCGGALSAPGRLGQLPHESHGIQLCGIPPVDTLVGLFCTRVPGCAGPGAAGWRLHNAPERWLTLSCTRLFPVPLVIASIHLLMRAPPPSHMSSCRRFTADFMAGHFLDYEPGIHYPQAQMQAGTTGINTFRWGRH